MHVNELLKYCASQEASDLHLKAMRPPLIRKEGKLYPTNGQPLSLQDLEELIQGILNPKQKAHLEEHLFVDFGYSLPGVSRFRATVFYQRSNLGAVFRRIPFDFPTLNDWGLPESIFEICKLPVGLVLVTGPTGSGKSSTLAAMIKEIIDNEPLHIVTIEDPIEFLFRDSVGSIKNIDRQQQTYNGKTIEVFHLKEGSLDISPSYCFDGKWFYAASGPDFMKQAFEAQAKKTGIQSNADFKKVTAGFPSQLNGISYTNVPAYLRMYSAILKKEGGESSWLRGYGLEEEMEYLSPYLFGAATYTLIRKDGIYFRSYASIPSGLLFFFPVLNSLPKYIDSQAW